MIGRTCVNVLHIVITKVKRSQAPCTLEVSGFEVMD